MERFSKIFCAFLFSAVSIPALAVTIDPDDYAAGTDLTSISPYLTITSVDSSTVYAASIDHSSPAVPTAGGYSTGPFGSQVFSLYPDSNSEFYYNFNPGDNGLVFDFHTAVSSVSFLLGEIFSDAGCCTDDPIWVEVYDETDTLVLSTYADFFPPTGYLGNPADPNDAWSYWEFSYDLSLVGKIIVGGESEPTTIDKLSFTPVPVPAAAWLFLSGVISLVGLARRDKS